MDHFNDTKKIIANIGGNHVPITLSSCASAGLQIDHYTSEAALLGTLDLTTACQLVMAMNQFCRLMSCAHAQPVEDLSMSDWLQADLTCSSRKTILEFL